ncbi:MAG TPA: vitamin K epoxide reductase family protein [Vicinamibacterales bacterium]|nr:vitamin K epoxide reductase family protein [Vicinamibacterales bacterium]
MTPRNRSLVLLFALVGLGFATASAWVHYKLITDPSYSSFCDVNATFNCTQVYLSQYGSFQGVSTALGGVVWFGLTVLLAAFGGATATNSKDKSAVSPVGSYIFAWATLGLAVVLYLAYASFFVLKIACILCIGTYLSVIAIFILSGSFASVPMGELPGRLAGDIRGLMKNPAMLTVALIFVVGVASVVAFFPHDTAPRTPAEAKAQANQQAPPPADEQQAWLAKWDAAPREQTGVPSDGAKVIIVKFNDFQCPGCRDGWVLHTPVIEEFEKTNPGAVKYVLKDYPLEPECNFAAQSMNHFSSCESAASVRMARAVGKGPEMEAWLFKNQTRLATGVEVVKEGLKEVTGLTNFAEQFPQMMDGIRQDVSDGVALRIGGTPTYFINGVRVTFNLPSAYLKLAIEHELKKAGTR